MNKEIKGLVYAGATTLLWGFLGIVLKFILVDLDSLSVVWFRFLSAFLLLLVLFLIKKPGDLKIIKRPPLLLIIAGVSLGLNYYFYMLGIEYTNPSITNVIIQVGPILLAFVGVVIYKEQIGFRQGVGFLLALCGFSLFYYDQLSSGAGDIYTDLNFGINMTVLAAIFWVIFASLQKKLTRDYSSHQINLLVYLIPTLMFLPLIDFSSFFNLEASVWAILLFLGLNTLFAYGALGEALKYAPANKVSIIITLNPIITLIAMNIMDGMGFDWLGKEMTSVYGYVGAVLIVAGATFAILRKSHTKRNNKSS